MDGTDDNNKTLAFIEFIMFCCFNGIMLVLIIYLLVRTCKVSREDIIIRKQKQSIRSSNLDIQAREDLCRFLFFMLFAIVSESMVSDTYSKSGI